MEDERVVRRPNRRLSPPGIVASASPYPLSLFSRRISAANTGATSNTSPTMP